MFGKFNDDIYDGVVLKIPSVFISANDINGDIEAFRILLDKCNKCRFMPDHLNNLYELENYKLKTDLKKEKDEIVRKREAAKRKERDDIIKGDIILLEYKKNSVISDYDTISIGDSDFKFDDIVTNKLNIKKPFIDSVYKEYNTFEKFRKFIKQNFSFGSYLIDNSSSITFKWDETNFSISRQGANIQCTLNNLYTQTVKKATKDSRYIYYNQLLEVEDGRYFVSNGNDRKYFDGYVLSNMSLIKK